MDENINLTPEDAERIVNEAIVKGREMIAANPPFAEIILRQVLRCVPDHPDGLLLYGLVKHRMGKHVEAIEVIQTAIELSPNNSDNYNNIALAYACLGQFDKAIQNLEKAVSLKPDHHLYMNNLALQYRQVGRYAEAIELLGRSLDHEKTAQILTNLGGIHGELKNLDAALACFREAVQIDPTCSAAHVDLAYCNHLLGRWDEGFKEYEWRFEYFPQLQFYKTTYDQSKRWDGTTSVEGKRILLYGEQGLGDLIHFSRYIKNLKERGAYTILHCSPVLKKMMDRCPWIDQTIVRDIVTGHGGDEFPDYDLQCSTMSLPYLLGSAACDGKPYLTVPEPKEPVDVFDAYKDKFKIGIVWAGSPNHPKDNARSVQLNQFRKLHDLPGVKLFNLQLDTRKRLYRFNSEVVDLTAGADDLKIVDLAPLIKDFDDTAYLISQLDLVVVVDTSVLHLAGAIGAPCWALIPYNPDWRWQISGETTHWYDSVRLFRQDNPHSWDSTFDRVTEALRETLL